jgi:hypothetical protein
VLINKFLESCKLSLGERVDRSNRRLGTFFQVDSEIIRVVRSKAISARFAEDVSKLMVFFGYIGKINQIIR